MSKSICNRRATQPPVHFQRNPLGRGPLAVFPRCALGPYQFRYGRFARALKNRQLTCGGVSIICEAVHYRNYPFLARQIRSLSCILTKSAKELARILCIT